jgi:hypothetical protein
MSVGIGESRRFDASGPSLWLGGDARTFDTGRLLGLLYESGYMRAAAFLRVGAESCVSG